METLTAGGADIFEEREDDESDCDYGNGRDQCVPKPVSTDGTNRSEKC